MKYFSIFMLNDEVSEFDTAIANGHRFDIERKSALSPKYPRFPRNPMFRKTVEPIGAVTYLDEETGGLLQGTQWETRLHMVTNVDFLVACKLV